MTDEECSAKFQKVTEAYDILSDKSKSKKDANMKAHPRERRKKDRKDGSRKKEKARRRA